MWRRKLTDCFGEDVLVKLDLFHAVKRLSNAMSKKHPLFFTCLQDFRLVFRATGDNGLHRTVETPKPDAITSNLENFVSKWSSISFNGIPILNDPAMKEISNLRIHINRGCLSSIPTGFGTNRNENLHRSLNKRLSGHTLGVELAVALLGTFFHMWNSRRRGDKTHSPATQFMLSRMEPTAESSDTEDQLLFHETFGIGIQEERRFDGFSLGTSFVRRLANDNIADVLWKIKERKSIEEGSNNTSVQQILQLLHDSLSTMYVNTKVQALSNIHASTHQLYPCRLPNRKRYSSIDTHQGRLQHVLASFHMKRIDVPADGDCLFTSIVKYFQTQVFSGNDPNHDVIIKHIQSKGIQPCMPNEVIISTLRYIMVEEWLSNRSEYFPFFERSTAENYEEEAFKYLNSGVYSTALWDAMLLGLSNALCLPIIVFTSEDSWPHVTIHPRHMLENVEPVYLALLHVGPGHFSFAVPDKTPTYQDGERESFQNTTSTTTSSSIDTHSISATETVCRCGRGRISKDRKRHNCSPNKRYASRCRCLKKENSCQPNCNCINCDNPYGQNQKVSQQSSNSRRKRHRHEEQDQRRLTSIKFMELSGEHPYMRSWTELEHHIFLKIINSLVTQDIHTLEIPSIEKKVFTLYKDVTEYVANSEELPLPLAHKNIKQKSDSGKSHQYYMIFVVQ